MTVLAPIQTPPIRRPPPVTAAEPTRWSTSSGRNGFIWQCRDTKLSVLRELIEDDRLAGEVIQARAGRTTVRWQSGHAEYFIKRQQPTTWRDRLKQIVRGDVLEQEFQRLQTLAARGVATPTVVAFGRRGSASVLITAGVTGAQRLADAVASADWANEPRRRRELARAVGRFLAQLHQAGVEHRDLHERNVLVVDEPTGPELVLIDVHEARLHSRPAAGSITAWMEQDLARFGRFFSLRARPADRCRCFAEYTEQRGFDDAERRSWSRRLELAVHESRARFWRRRDRRRPYQQRGVLRIRTTRRRAWGVEALPDATSRPLIATPDLPIETQTVRWFKQGNSTQVAEVEVAAGATLVCKRFGLRGWARSLASLVRPTQARRAWRASRWLALRELPTPARWLLVEETKFGLPLRSYLWCECLHDALPLGRHLDRVLRGQAPAEQRRIVRGTMFTLGRLLRTMHERGVDHGDLKSSNLLARVDIDPAAPLLWLIDLDSVRTGQNLSASARARNLAWLFASLIDSRWLQRTDAVRCLKAYLGPAFRERRQWQGWYRQIVALADAKLRKSQRPIERLI